MLDGIGELRRLAVRYERSRGTSWARIGEVLGIDPAEAERRWGAGAEPAPGPRPEPAQLARELDTWFVRRLWTLEATEAAIADPVTRLLDATGPAPASCLICRKYDGDAVPAWAGRAEPPGGHLVDDGVWRVGHAPTVFSPAGSLLVESHRHFLDYADMEPHEASTYGAPRERLRHPRIADPAHDREVVGHERVIVRNHLQVGIRRQRGQCGRFAGVVRSEQDTELRHSAHRPGRNRRYQDLCAASRSSIDCPGARPAARQTRSAA